MRAYWLCGTVAGLGLVACANQPQSGATAAPPAAPPAVVVQAPPPPPPPAPPPPPPTLPHGEAVLTAANALFSKVDLDGVAPAANKRYTVVVDPLIDGVSRMQTRATQQIEQRINQLVKASYPQFDIKPLSKAVLDQNPLVVIGTFTPINQQGKTEGLRDQYRFCLAMVDLKSGKLVSKTVARSRMEQVDAAPLRFFADAPAWTQDAPAEGYVKTCQASKAGDPIQSAYLAGLVATSSVEEGIRHYNNARWKEAEAAFARAHTTAAGKQLRVLSGLYLSQWRQGKRDASVKSLSQLLDYGIEQGKLAMMFAFARGSTVLPADAKPGNLRPDLAEELAKQAPPLPNQPGQTRGFKAVPAEEQKADAQRAETAPPTRGFKAVPADPVLSPPQQLWVEVLAQRLAADKRCAEVQGHTSRGGPEEVNERISALRAEHVRRRLTALQPELEKRLIAVGLGSRDNLVGTGKDDASDQLDRRVDFKLLPCSS